MTNFNGSDSGLNSFSSFSFDRYNSETKRLLIGPSFRVEMQSGFGIEVDALYQRVAYDHATMSMQSGPPATSGQSFEQTTANRWQFPLLIQYTWTLRRTNERLFVEAGPSISRIAGSRSKITTTTISDTSTSSSQLSVRGQGGTLAGIVAGGGVDLSLSRLHLRPEFRYSHWFSPMGASPAGVFGAVVAPAGSLSNILTTVPLVSSFRTQQNEASFLVGLTF